MASERTARGTLPFLRNLLFHLRLRGDAGVIGSRYPKSVVTLHSVPANQNVLNGVGQRMTHVKHARDVGRRNHNTEGLLPRNVLLGRIKASRLAPKAVDVLLEPGGFVTFA